MPREYKQKAGIKTPKKHDKATIEKAVAAVKAGMSLRDDEKRFGISKTVIARHKADPNVGSRERHVLLGDVEDMLVKRLKTCAEWGYPMDSWTLRLTVKGYLDRRGVKHKVFQNNLPGPYFTK